MMNEQARKIFSELLDVNHEYAEMQMGMRTGKVTSMMELITLGKKVNELDSQFKEAMGANAYKEFMRQGREMFAPAM